MSDLIQWPRAQYWNKPWNPVIGCRHCSPACDNCYARELFTSRFHKSFDPMPTNKQHPPTKGVVFVGNATDLFGEWMDVPQIWAYFSKLWYFTKDGSPRPNDATYLFCTKRVGRMCEALRNYTEMPHCYFGFTAEKQEWYDLRLKAWTAPWTSPLKHTNGWLSCEPLLGSIDLRFYTYWNIPKWVAVGCESGPKRRPCKLEWVESIVDQCRAANVPVFVKQLDIGGKCERDITKFPKHLQIRQVPWAKNGGAR